MELKLKRLVVKVDNDRKAIRIAYKQLKTRLNDRNSAINALINAIGAYENTLKAIIDKAGFAYNYILQKPKGTPFTPGELGVVTDILVQIAQIPPALYQKHDQCNVNVKVMITTALDAYYSAI